MAVIIVEGIDNVGKTSFIREFKNRYGFYNVIKYDKPERLNCYNGQPDTALEMYQRCSYSNGFSLIAGAAAKRADIIFDRFHLGEYVYAPLYRGYSGDYVFTEEELVLRNDVTARFSQCVYLILLHAINPGALPDDGKSFDASAAEKEQKMFFEAYKRSKIKNKIMIQVQNQDGSFRKPEEIINDFKF